MYVDYELGGPAGVHLELRTRTGQCKLDPWAPELSGGPVDVTMLCRRGGGGGKSAGCQQLPPNLGRPARVEWGVGQYQLDPLLTLWFLEVGVS